MWKMFDDRPGGLAGRCRSLYLLLIGANIAAWAWAFAAFADKPTLLGTALLAYLFGLRHAIDADHIAAIDNVVRKLMQEGKKPLSVGFFFSLGHSTIVILAAATLALTAAALHERFDDFKDLSGVIGTSVSAAFLLVIAAANIVILRGVWKSFDRVRNGATLDEAALDTLLSGRGFFARMFRPMFRAVRASWQMYPLGFLFGLGFDTATEIGLLGISAAEAANGLPWWMTLVFPALFTAGMALIDTTDSVIMVGAYGWAFVNPMRKLWYNLTITAVSVVIAVVIGGIEGLGLIGDKLGLEGAFWSWIGSLSDNLGSFGFAIMTIMLAVWALSFVLYRWKRLDRPAPEIP